MSMPTYQLHCERCDYSAGSGLTWGHFEYETDSGRLPVDRSLGWCNHCHGFQPIECFDSVDEEWLWADFELLEDAVKAGFWGRLGRLLGFFKHRDQQRLDKLQQTFESLLLAIRRKGSERCLRCGSTDYYLKPGQALNDRQREEIRMLYRTKDEAFNILAAFDAGAKVLLFELRSDLARQLVEDLEGDLDIKVELEGEGS